MKPQLFPTHFKIILDEYDRSDLDTLYDLNTHILSELELVHTALKRGIKAMTADANAKGKDPIRPTRTQLEAGKKASASAVNDDSFSTSFPEHLELDLTAEQCEGMQYLGDHLPHGSDTELLSKVLSRGIDIVEMETRHASGGGVRQASVPSYIGFALEERLRKRLEDFLEAHPDAMTEEAAYGMLLDLGLDHAGNRPMGEVLKGAKKAARLRRMARLARP